MTAYDSYALRAFEVHAVDYVLKPFRARAAPRGPPGGAGAAGTPPEPAVLAQAARKAGEYSRRIVVKDANRIHMIPVESLDYAQAQDDYVALHSEGKTYLKTQTMGALEASLDPAALRARAPLVPGAPRPHPVGRALREEQPDRDPPGRHARCP